MDARQLWPDPGQEIDHWGTLAGKVRSENGIDAVDYPLPRPFLLGIRGVAPYEAATHELIDQARYDDTYVLFHPNGLVPPHVFPGATHAFQRNSTASTDENHDGVGDVGTIDPGRFVLRLDSSGKYPVFVFEGADGSRVFRGHRDVDHDGIPETPCDDLTSILFHYGYDAPADSVHRSSIGCCTASPQYVNELAATVKGYDAIDLVIVTAAHVLDLVVPPAPETNA